MRRHPRSSAVIYVPRQAQRPQAVHILDGRLAPSVLFLQGVVYFHFTRLIALKKSLRVSAILRWRSVIGILRRDQLV
jgi:hypothetical protein